ncbi:hypothetical protein RJ53_10360 [Methanocalculus chunghsingensis]|uniref:Uncharacterized protein n=2 Tax=Methanocalculus chunghsingensis TaxID=156457 RepID=A0A8J7WBG1_9EURY|nr:hypothetical protein [Methanocalculus chunghsingensis]
MFRESYSSEYSYQVTISAERSLDNVTLILPLPSWNGNSPIGEAILQEEGYGFPDDWKCSLVEIDGAVMLQISADRIVPTYRNLITPTPIRPGETPPPTPEIITSTEYSEATPVLIPIEFGVSLRDVEEINTRDPLGNEPVLSPKRNLTLAEEPYDTPTPPGGVSVSSYYTFESPFSAAYACDPETLVTIDISHQGGNSWWVLGWSGNSFRESVSITLIGPDPGWQYGTGSLRTGEGRYR